MQQKRILIVEDEGIIAQSLKFTLIEMGYNVVAILSEGKQAIQFVETNLVDLILMDIQINGNMDGIETAHIIQKHYTHLPIIYLTAYADKHTIDRACITGPYGYILKPFEDRELQICIEVALYKSQANQKIQETEARLYTTLKCIAEPIIILDRLLNVNFCNFLAEEFLQTQSGQLLNTNFDTKFQIESSSGQCIRPVEESLQKGIVIKLPTDAIIRTDEGLLIPAGESFVSAIINDQGDILGAVITLKTSR